MSSAEHSKTRVLLVDDHPMVRRGLASLIEEESDLVVCAEAGDVSTALQLVSAVRPDLAIIDIQLKDQDGLELIKEIHCRDPEVRLLVLSMYDEGTYAARALRAGASGYVMKAEADETLMTAIRQVLAGKIYASETVTNQLLHLVTKDGRGTPHSKFTIERLSDRELQILRLLGEGIKVRAIAAQLYLSIKTVETHRANIRKKLGIANSADLLRYAIQFSRNRT